MEKKAPDISVVIPFHNEEVAIEELTQELLKALTPLKRPFEILYIDDGSLDQTFANLKKAQKAHKDIRVFKLRFRRGQSAALMAGFDHIRGSIVVALDGDMQNHPKDIPILITKLEEGYDVVSGRKMNRKGAVYNVIANIGYMLRKLLLGVLIHDTAVVPNAYRRECLEGIKLYGEIHRFLVPMLYLKGYKVIEVPIPFYARKGGVSKYSPMKAERGFLDLLTVKFWHEYSVRPMHFFGKIGIRFILVGGIIGVIFILRKAVLGISIYNSVFPMFAIGLVIIGIQFIMLGVLADMIARIYYHDTNPYDIEEIIE